MKTIRQIADEIGVSKTAVNKQIANLGLRSGLRKNGNQFAIDEHQEALIKQAFSEKSQTEIENQSQTKTQTENHEVGDLVCVLQATIDTLQGQLNCVTGITANRERCRDMVEHSVGIITALCPHVGYEKAAEVAKRAIETGAPVRRLILEEGLLDEAALDKILDPYSMTEPGISGKELLEG